VLALAVVGGLVLQARAQGRVDRVGHAPVAVQTQQEMTTPRVSLFGYVTMIEARDEGGLAKCRALLELRDEPDKDVAVLTDSLHLQGVLQTALLNRTSIQVEGRKRLSRKLPDGATSSADLYFAERVVLHRGAK
jgi:hypothetical protein